MKRKLSALVALVGTLMLALAACSSPATTGGAASGGSASAKDSYTIGVAQYVSHPSLDAAVKGFKKAITDAGLNVTYDEQNAQADQGTSTSIASKFASSKPDLILAVATPIAQAVAQSVTDAPVLFTAVTDPKSAQLVASNDAPGANVTGTTDLNPVAEQIGLVKKVLPNAKRIGVIYSSGEVNSEVQVALAREEAKKLGMELVEKTITNSSEVVQAAQTLGDVDAIYVPTDNAVVSALESVLQVAEQGKKLVVSGEADSVQKGAALTYGLDYEKLGEQTGKMAVKILTEGGDPATMPVEAQEKPQLVVNPAAAERMGVPLPKDLVDQADRVIK
ncbi:putative ABC transport system substrate-binding protein [Arcanobacterium wilhelmae]|uniref:ABC transport system substrate-binding protein n=1 Tax=Arcanobacterium wilhelmae TaxID=1803177 RepID=A0ABT9NB52_9ACTO|nr:ABC transporter substrate-binding protein [Arcanobacterium wilhelmae]MDP9800933.1 putative ABC transport system substrate-binding protein [Arcanobacterium wilhelmae]WFN90293.1 ABC transporter substrate-binding protein [Arcanobacterium wilhelmae]